MATTKKKTTTSKKTTAQTPEIVNPTAEVIVSDTNPMTAPVPPVQKRNNRWMFVVSLMVVLLFGGWLLYQEMVVASVNGQPIYRWEVIKVLEQQGGSQVVDGMITEALIRQAAEEQGVVVEDAEVEEEIVRLSQQLGVQGQSLELVLEAQGMSLEELRRQVRTQLLVERIAPAAEVATDEDVAEMVALQADSFPDEMSEADRTDYVRDQLANQADSEAIQVWLTDLKESADIEYLKAY